jgi:sugar phosphate isomerase/epimerase
MDRRTFLASSAALGLAASAQAQPEKPYQGKTSPWPISMNTSTIRPASLEEKINVTAKAGYDAIEPWIDDIENHEKAGGNLKDLGKSIQDKGLSVPNVIGLWGCMPEGEEAFQASLPATRERMRRAADIGSQHVAAIPAPDRANFDLKEGARMYRELLRIGREDYGITVGFEFIGFFKSVHRLGQASAVALDTNDRNACLIADTFHLFRGDSGFNGIRHLQGSFIANFHFNDVPDSPERTAMGDEHRIYPGDGILPLEQLCRDLVAIDYRGPLSLELFNRAHWEQDPYEVAKTGLDKTLAVVHSALS